MTWVALFTSWQFWLVIIVNTFLSTFGGICIVALMKANGPDPEPLPTDLTLELMNLREENRRLTEANFALNLQNAALERELNALDPGFADYGTEQRPDEAADGRRT